MKKTIILVIVFLFLSLVITPTFGMSDKDDTIPPVSTHSLDPPEPDGWNGWYVNDVNVTLNATDDMSGVREILYRINDNPIQTFTGDNGTFIIDIEGKNNLVEYWAIDNAGNEEVPHQTFTISIDKTKPDIDLKYEWGGSGLRGWDFRFHVRALDGVSGMEQVEFYLNDELKKIIYGHGPYYSWDCYNRNYGEFNVEGFICGRKITDEYVKFYGVIVIVEAIADWEKPFEVTAFAYDKAGNIGSDIIKEPVSKETVTPGIYLFKSLTLPNNYTGKIGLFFINAVFNIPPVEDARVIVKGTSDQIKVTLVQVGSNYNDGYVIADDVEVFIDGIKVSSYTTEIWEIGEQILLGDTNSGSWEEGETCEEGYYEVTVSIKDMVVFDFFVEVG